MTRIFTLLLLLAAPAVADDTCPHPQVCFRPGPQNCAAVVVAEIARAKSTVHVQAYGFTSAPIAKALLDAKKRGVDVQVVLDRSNVHARYSSARFLANVGVPVFIDGAHAIAHNKVVIVDGAVVATGSYNLTTAAEVHNAENLIVLHDVALVSQYEANWQAHRRHSAALETQ